jgi:tetratricopeptide (TPR) repeat protein
LFLTRFFTQTTWRVTIVVLLVMFAALVATGFVSSAYKRERGILGEEHFRDGEDLRSHGDSSAAMEQFRQALIFSPDNSAYRLALAETLIDAGRLDEAQAHLQQLIAADPTNGVLNLLLARVAVKRNLLKQAVEYYQRAVYEYWPATEIPQRREARWELANLLEQTGNRTAYIAELMQLYAGTNPQQQTQMIEIGSRLREAGATSEAQQVFQQVVKTFPRSSGAYLGLAEVAFDSGEYISARHDFQRALKAAPKDQQISARLDLTNEIIGLDPELPNLATEERLRRSRNLLSRVVAKLEACGSSADLAFLATPSRQEPPQPAAHDPGSTSPNALQQELSTAAALLSAHPSQDEDLAVQMQESAARLWRDRALFCQNHAPIDDAIETVVTRLGE